MIAVIRLPYLNRAEDFVRVISNELLNRAVLKA